jgi:hypothetical protein
MTTRDAHPAPGLTVRDRGTEVDLYVGGHRTGSYTSPRGLLTAIERNRARGLEAAERYARAIAGQHVERPTEDRARKMATVTYAVHETGGDGIHAITLRKIARPGETDTTTVSLSMFKGDLSDQDAVAEHARKVLKIAAGHDVTVLSVEVHSMSCRGRVTTSWGCPW